MKTLTIHLEDAIYAKLVAEAAFYRRRKPEDQVPFTLAAHYQMNMKFDPKAKGSSGGGEDTHGGMSEAVNS